MALAGIGSLVTSTVIDYVSPPLRPDRSRQMAVAGATTAIGLCGLTTALRGMVRESNGDPICLSATIIDIPFGVLFGTSSALVARLN